MAYFDGNAGAEQADLGKRTLSEVPSTELNSLLATNLKQAYEIHRAVETVLDRVAPQPKEESAGDAACNSGGYVGQAEQLRSTQQATLAMLSSLTKLA